MFELLVVGLLAALVVGGLLFVGAVAMFARFVWWVLLLPFHVIGWVLGGIGLLLALPFVILGTVVAVTLGVGVFLLFSPLLPLVFVACTITWLVRRSRRAATAS